MHCRLFVQLQRYQNQPFFVFYNNRIAEQWLSEITDEDDLKEYKDTRLLGSQICNADFKCGILAVFITDEVVSFDEWKATVSKVILSGSQSSLLWLRYVAQNHVDKGCRLYVISKLGSAGQLDAAFKALIIQAERDSEILEYLRNH